MRGAASPAVADLAAQEKAAAAAVEHAHRLERLKRSAESLAGRGDGRYGSPRSEPYCTFHIMSFTSSTTRAGEQVGWGYDWREMLHTYWSIARFEAFLMMLQNIEEVVAEYLDIASAKLTLRFMPNNNASLHNPPFKQYHVHHSPTNQCHP